MASLARTKSPSRQKANLPELVDEFGRLKAQMADLEARAQELKEEFKNSKLSQIEGQLFRVVISRYSMGRVDWKAIAEALNPPPSLVRRNTERQNICRIEAKAR